MEHAPPDTIDLRDYLAVAARQWIVIVLLTVAVTGVAVGLASLQTPMYESTAEMAIEPVRSGGDQSIQTFLLRGEIVETERRILRSESVTERVIEELALDTTSVQLLRSVDVRTVPDTRVLTITVTSSSAQRAADIANAFTTAYADHRRESALEDIASARAALEGRIVEVTEQLAALGPESATEDASDQVRRESLLQQLAQLEGQLAATGSTADEVGDGAEVLVRATPAEVPSSPRPVRTGVLALVLGLMLGVGVAFLRDHFDDAVRGDDDVRRVAPGVTIVARVGHWKGDEQASGLMTIADPFAGASEEFQAMAANVRFALVARERRRDEDADRRGRDGDLSPSQAVARSLRARAEAVARDRDERTGSTVVVTSASESEGKTTVACNLAVAAANAGQRVILVGADLRKPTMATRFGVPESVGLTDLIAATYADPSAKVGDFLIDVGVPRLRILPAGSLPAGPTELLASPQMQRVQHELTELADLVIFDTPPVLPVADTLELAQRVELAFLVVRSGATHRRALANALDRLDTVGADVSGIVVNDLGAGRGGYGYGYGYGYGQRGGAASEGPVADTPPPVATSPPRAPARDQQRPGDPVPVEMDTEVELFGN